MLTIFKRNLHLFLRPFFALYTLIKISIFVPFKCIGCTVRLIRTTKNKESLLLIKIFY